MSMLRFTLSQESGKRASRIFTNTFFNVVRLLNIFFAADNRDNIFAARTPFVTLKFREVGWRIGREKEGKGFVERSVNREPLQLKSSIIAICARQVLAPRSHLDDEAPPQNFQDRRN